MDSKSKTFILTLVRHGQTNGNKEKVLHGWTDTVSLNDTGLKQAQAAGQALKKHEFHLAFSSDLQRANKTCQVILEENEASVITSEHIQKHKLLRERNFGIFEGKSNDLCRDFMDKHGVDTAPENGESGFEVKKRADEFLKFLAKVVMDIDKETPNVLVASHYGLICKMVSMMFLELNCEVGSNVTNVPDFNGGSNKLKPANTSFSRFEIDVCTEDYTIKTMKCLELINADHLKNLS